MCYSEITLRLGYQVTDIANGYIEISIPGGVEAPCKCSACHTMNELMNNAVHLQCCATVCLALGCPMVTKVIYPKLITK